MRPLWSIFKLNTLSLLALACALSAMPAHAATLVFAPMCTLWPI